MTHKLHRDRRLKIGKSALKAYRKAASKCSSGAMRDAVASAWTPGEQARHQTRKLGTFGAASPVVRIDPVTGSPIEGGQV